MQRSTRPRPAAPRTRATWITIVAVAVVSASALFAVPAAAGDGPLAVDRVIVCESGIVEQGAVITSSAVATRVSAAAPVPDGCREG